MQSYKHLIIATFIAYVVLSGSYAHSQTLNMVIHPALADPIVHSLKRTYQDTICIPIVNSANTYLANGKFEMALRLFRRYEEMQCNVSELNAAVLSKIGHLTVDGNGTSQDIASGIQYLEKAVTLGDCKANTILGYVYLDDKYAVKNINKSLDYFVDAASCGEYSAHYIAGILYGYAEYGIQDINMALYHLEVAAQNKHPDAYGVIGKIYYYGEGVDENTAEALKYFLMGANSGDGESALFSSAIYYYDENNAHNAALWLFVSNLLGFPCEQEAPELYAAIQSCFNKSEIDIILQAAHKKYEDIVKSKGR